jgi:uncharacterized protein YwqG
VNAVFAATQPAVIAVIREWARATGTPDDTVVRIVAGLSPSIRLARKKGGTMRKGGTRAGGLPDLPPGTNWPRAGTGDEGVPMSMVLQINLAEIAPFDPDKLLPAAGLLSLFYYWDDDGGEDEGRVLYFPAPVATLSRPQWPDDIPDENRYRTYSLEPRAEWTLPNRDNLGEVPEVELETWFDLCDKVSVAQELGNEKTAHRLLGHPDLIQSAHLKEGQVLLLQAGPDYGDKSGMQWGDGGMLYATLTEAELKAGKLDAAKLFLEMG